MRDLDLKELKYEIRGVKEAINNMTALEAVTQLHALGIISPNDYNATLHEILNRTGFQISKVSDLTDQIGD